MYYLQFKTTGLAGFQPHIFWNDLILIIINSFSLIRERLTKISQLTLVSPSYIKEYSVYLTLRAIVWLDF